MPISFSGTNIDEVIWKVTSGSGTAIGMSADSGTNTIPSFTAINNGSTAISVEIAVTPKSAEGCIGETKTFTITVYTQTPLEVNLGNDTTICWLDSLKLNAHHPQATHYQWQDGSTGITYTVYYDGQYWVTVSNPCSETSDTINVSYLKNIRLNLKDTVFCESDNIYWSLDVSSPHASYLWQDGSTSPVYIIEQAGIYSVIVSNICMSVTGKVEVKTKDCSELEIWLPNAFTPNGDGLNDVFKPVIQNPELHIKEYKMYIYNRWGNIIFLSSDYSIGWDGKNYQGKDCSDGVYFCVIRFTDMSNKEFIRQTSVTLIR
jgi:gliding motility-associated-like protein